MRGIWEIEDRSTGLLTSGRVESSVGAGEFVVKGRKVLVVGLARSGAAASRVLASKGALVTATDKKPASEIACAEELRDLGVRLALGGHTGDGIGDVDLVVVSPGVPQCLPLLDEARKRGVEVISEMELAWRFMDCPVVAVTGTNGKSTTTALIGEIFSAAGNDVFVGGNIGTPAVEYAERDRSADLCVLEVSSFHLETTVDFNPHVGVLLNLTEDHLDRYPDFIEYAETKFRLFRNQTPGDFAVINADDPLISERALAGLSSGRLIPFTTSGTFTEGVYLKESEIVFSFSGEREVYPTEGIKLKGLHNIENVMAAVAAARLMGMPRELVLKALSEFRGLRHRMEFVRELDGVTYINDSKGTNIGSLMMALKGLKTPVVLIAGGVDKGGDYAVLAPLIREKVRLLVLIGEAREKIKDSLGHLAETVMATSLEKAVLKAREKAVVGDTVLLCPACSSFDMFIDYNDRGERFRQAVEGL